LEKVRIEADNALARAEKAEAKVKELESKILTLDSENQSLSNKISLLTSDIERAEKRVEEVIFITINTRSRLEILRLIKMKQFWRRSRGKLGFWKNQLMTRKEIVKNRLKSKF
jgi:hypothetical protein